MRSQGKVIMIDSPLTMSADVEEESIMREVEAEVVEEAILEVVRMQMATEAKAQEAREVGQEVDLEEEQEDQEVAEVTTEEEKKEHMMCSTIVALNPMVKKAVKTKSPRRNSNSWRMQSKSTERSSEEFAM